MSSLIVSPAHLYDTYDSSPSPFTIDTVKSVTLNLTFLSFASIPESRWRRSLDTNRV
jgi:hypothetical protein